MPWKLQRSQVIIAVLPMLVLAVGVTLAWRQQQPAAAQAVATSPAETPFRRVSLAPLVEAPAATQNLREAAAEPTEEPSYRTPLPNTPPRSWTRCGLR